MVTTQPGIRTSPVYPNGKSWDEIPGRMSSEKKFFHNAISGADFAAQPYYVAIVTSFIRCDIGGLEIDEDSEILESGSQAIRGLQGTGGAREEPGFLCFVLAFSTMESLNGAWSIATGNLDIRSQHHSQGVEDVH